MLAMQSLFRHFVKHFAELYGDDQVSYNIHCTLRLANDVHNQGPLDAFSAFPFENNMQFLKRLLRRHGAPLTQLLNRLKEREDQLAAATNSPNGVHLTRQHQGRPLPAACRLLQYKCAHFPNFVLAIDGRQLMHDWQLHWRSTQAPCVIGREFMVKDNFYEKPFPSGTIGVFAVSQPSDTKCWPVRNVSKLAKHPWNGKLVIIPQLHTH